MNRVSFYIVITFGLFLNSASATSPNTNRVYAGFSACAMEISRVKSWHNGKSNGEVHAWSDISPYEYCWDVYEPDWNKKITANYHECLKTKSITKCEVQLATEFGDYMAREGIKDVSK